MFCYPAPLLITICCSINYVQEFLFTGFLFPSRFHRRLRLQWAQQLSARHVHWQYGVSPMNPVIVTTKMVYEYASDIRKKNISSTICYTASHCTNAGIMLGRAIGYECRSHLMHIVGNPNSDRFIREIVETKVFSILNTFRMLYLSSIMPVSMFLRLHKPFSCAQ